MNSLLGGERQREPFRDGEGGRTWVGTQAGVGGPTKKLRPGSTRQEEGGGRSVLSGLLG